MNRNFPALFCLIVLLFSCSKGDGDKNLYPGLSIPLYAGASESTIKNDKDSFGQNTIYKLKEAVPPENIFDFYNAELTKLGFEQNNEAAFLSKNTGADHLAQGIWTSPPARYLKGWANHDKTIVIKTTLNYTNDNKVKIDCFIHPYSDPEPLLNYLKALDKTGEIDEFNNILSIYGLPNKNLDIKKALEEQPNNKIVIALSQIMEKSNAEVQSNYDKYINSLDD
jgi:hypothetical protein